MFCRGSSRESLVDRRSRSRTFWLIWPLLLTLGCTPAMRCECVGRVDDAYVSIGCGTSTCVREKTYTCIAINSLRETGVCMEAHRGANIEDGGTGSIIRR